MSDAASAPAPVEEPDARLAMLEEAARRWPFGPLFFVGQLGAFTRDHCPDPAEGLPFVEIHLVDGEVLDLCHVIGVGPAWAALAVNDAQPDGSVKMRTEFVPYAAVVRVTVRPSRPESPRLGFDVGHEPALLAHPDDPGRASAADAAEQAVRAAAGVTPRGGGGTAGGGATDGGGAACHQ